MNCREGLQRRTKETGEGRIETKQRQEKLFDQLGRQEVREQVMRVA